MRKTVVTMIALFFVAAIAVTLVPQSNFANTEEKNRVELFAGDFDLDASIEAGKLVYEGKGTCAVCHQATGMGLPPAFPPLAEADYLVADVQRAVKQTMYGSKTPIVVNGTTYPGGVMTITEMTDEEVRDVVNYILNSWGNDAGTVTVEDVEDARE